MIWKNCSLLGHVRACEELLDSNGLVIYDCNDEAVLVDKYDKLGNPVYIENQHIKTVPARFTPINDKDLHLDGRSVSDKTRKLLLRLPFISFPECKNVEFEGVIYKIEESTALNRFVLLYLTKLG